MKKQTHSAHWFAKSKSWTVCAVRLCTAFLVWLLCSCIPIFYMLSTSFKSYNDLINPTVKWFPKDFSPENYRLAAQALDFVYSGLNTIL